MNRSCRHYSLRELWLCALCKLWLRALRELYTRSLVAPAGTLRVSSRLPTEASAKAGARPQRRWSPRPILKLIQICLKRKKPEALTSGFFISINRGNGSINHLRGVHRLPIRVASSFGRSRSRISDPERCDISRIRFRHGSWLFPPSPFQHPAEFPYPKV